MKNVTITLEEGVLERARKAAADKGQSLNAFLRELITSQVRKPGSRLADELFEAMDRLPKTEVGITWKREDLYRY